MSLVGLESKLSQGAGKRGKASPRVSPARLRLGAGASHPLPLPGSVLRRPGSVQAEAAPSTRPVPGQCRLHCGVGTLAAPHPLGSKLPAACVTSGAGFVQGVWEPLSHPHRAAAPGTCCGGAQKPWSSEEACGQRFRLPSWMLLRLWGLWPGLDWVTCGERRVPCPFTLSSARLPPPKLLASSPPAEPVAILSAPEASFDTPPRPH